MACAYEIAKLSKARRKKVGAIIVAAEGGIIAEGFNGTPCGFDNNCEHEVRERLETETCTILVTKEEVLHAESNAIAKVAESTNSSKGATLYCTLMPCLQCAKMIIQCGITRVRFGEVYPYVEHVGEARPVGLELLEKAGIDVDILPVVPQNSVGDDLNVQEEAQGRDGQDAWRP